MKIKIGTKGVASNIGEKVQQTGETIAESSKSAVNTALDGTKNAASSLADGAKNLAATGAEKTEQAWLGLFLLQNRNLFIEYSDNLGIFRFSAKIIRQFKLLEF